MFDKNDEGSARYNLAKAVARIAFELSIDSSFIIIIYPFSFVFCDERRRFNESTQ